MHFVYLNFTNFCKVCTSVNVEPTASGSNMSAPLLYNFIDIFTIKVTHVVVFSTEHAYRGNKTRPFDSYRMGNVGNIGEKT